MDFTIAKETAIKLDERDSLRSYRNLFHLPKYHKNDAIYFCGNSLGLQPKSVEKYLTQELNDWRTLAVKGHFEAKNPWFYYHNFLTKPIAGLVGAKEKEIVAMNALTVNLHLLMVSFYRPQPNRYKILIDTPIFPSDRYALQSQADFHGYSDALIEVNISTCSGAEANNKIKNAIIRHKHELALVLTAGVNYYSGHFFDHALLAATAHEHGITYGTDLAHAIGNVPLKLNDWKVDFAVWCSYKYLNSSPGGVSGIFVHENHHQKKLPQFRGWWGTDEQKRFMMDKTFIPQEGAGAWQLSNAPILGMAAQRASLEIFEQAGIENLRKKSIQLTAYLEFLLKDILKTFPGIFEMITPPESQSRGCQLSLLFHKNGETVFKQITARGVVADWRKPNVIRIAPVPLYNSFNDVWQFYNILKEEIKTL